MSSSKRYDAIQFEGQANVRRRVKHLTEEDVRTLDDAKGFFARPNSPVVHDAATQLGNHAHLYGDQGLKFIGLCVQSRSRLQYIIDMYDPNKIT